MWTGPLPRIKSRIQRKSIRRYRTVARTIQPVDSAVKQRRTFAGSTIDDPFGTMMATTKTMKATARTKGVCDKTRRITDRRRMSSDRWIYGGSVQQLHYRVCQGRAASDDRMRIVRLYSLCLYLRRSCVRATLNSCQNRCKHQVLFCPHAFEVEACSTDLTGDQVSI